MSQALACSLPRACSVHRNMKTMAKICFLTPGLYVLLSAKCGVRAAPKGKGWKVRDLRGAILYFRQEGMVPAASCTQLSCVTDPTSARVILTWANFYHLKSLCFRDKWASRHLSALKSVSVLRCGTSNYQREENQELYVKSKHPWDAASWHRISPSCLPSFQFNRLPIVTFAELQLLKFFYSYRICSKDSIMKTENVHVSLAGMSEWLAAFSFAWQGMEKTFSCRIKDFNTKLARGQGTHHRASHNLPKKSRSRAA